MKVKKSYTRGNTFDPMFLQYLMTSTGYKDPFHWRVVRDTRSMIEGMSFGMKVDNDFRPKEIENQFIKHDPKLDIILLNNIFHRCNPNSINVKDFKV